MLSRVYIFLIAAFSLANAIPRGLESHKMRNNYGVTGGETADIQNYPYMASLHIDLLGVVLGSGAILSKDWIVCSAYQLSGLPAQLFTVRVGSSNAASGGQVVGIAKAIRHEQFDTDYPYDIALLKTNESLALSKTVKAIKLASKLPAAGTQAQITGFGKTEDGSKQNILDLKAAKVTVLSQDECKTAHPSIDGNSFCAHSDGVGPCESDMGSPLVSNNQLIGFYTGGDVCNYYGEPEIYTNVPVMAKWIKDTMKKNSNEEEMEVFVDDNSV